MRFKVLGLDIMPNILMIPCFADVLLERQVAERYKLISSHAKTALSFQ